MFQLPPPVVFRYDGNIFKTDMGTVPLKMELFATISNGRVYNQWTVVIACCCGNSTIFTGKVKIRWKWSCFEGGIRCDFLFCRYVLTFFQKHQLLSLTFSFISKINYKNELTAIIANFIFQGFINRSNHQHIFWKMLLIKCRKNSCEGVLF